MAGIAMKAFIKDLNNVDTIEDLNDLFIKQIGQFGFDRMILCFQSAHREIDVDAQMGVAHNLSTSWMDYYHAHNLYQIDPVQQAARLKSEAFSWEEADKIINMSLRQQQMMKLVEDHNLFHGIISLCGGTTHLQGSALRDL